MPQSLAVAVENNFTKGLITEFTGLNFPENAATDCDNCEFTIVGDVLRRQGIDAELNFNSRTVPEANVAVSSFVWTNAGGDGTSKLEVRQDGRILSFYRIHSATLTLPLSAQLIPSTVSLASFVASGGTFDNTLECRYAAGNGYLFVFHPSCDPVYCTYTKGVETVVANRITVQIRDFLGVPDGLGSNIRPTSLSVEHNYNLLNQGWVSGNPWSTASSTLISVGLGSKVFVVAAGLTVTLGDQVTIIVNHATSSGLPQGPIMSGNVTAYSGTSMTINVTSGATGYFGIIGNDWLIVPRDTAYIASWFSAVGNYPSNSDVWWYFKDATGTFAPTTTLSNVTLGAGNGPRGHFVLDAFSQQRDIVSNLAITDISTNIRPSTGTWFQGRVWYAGVDAQQVATGDVDTYSWTENIYFSQIVNTVNDFGHCYQVNDPTSEKLFDLLPTDGGVIQIQGCGRVYKLFPTQNGLLVHAGNGIWFITGSQGIGFAANDYTITKISSIQCISSTSFVEVQGLPYFWNEEGIYSIQPSKNGGFEVDPITVGTILSFYNEIPLASKQYVRGDYSPIDYIIQWTYRSTAESNISQRYLFDKILNYSVYNKAFFPYTISQDPLNNPFINGVNYISYPQTSPGTPPPGFKYPTTFVAAGTVFSTFSEENNTEYLDWGSTAGGLEYSSYFVTGFKLRGQGIKKFQPQYIQVYSRVDEVDSGYFIQGIWNYAINRNSGKYSAIQKIDIPGTTNYSTKFRRHKIRGSGYVLQFKITSQTTKPFDIQGWSVIDTVNQGA